MKRAFVIKISNGLKATRSALYKIETRITAHLSLNCNKNVMELSLKHHVTVIKVWQIISTW